MENSTKLSYILAGTAFFLAVFLIWQNVQMSVPRDLATNGKAEKAALVQEPSPKIISSDQKTTAPQAPITLPAGYRTYNDNAGRFSFECPDDWEFTEIKDYGESADFFECAKMFSGQYGFEDGVSVNFGFVPKDVYENYEDNGKKESEAKIADVKDQENSQLYSNNLFNGWISMKSGGHTFRLAASRETDSGYYEARVEAAGSVRTDSYFKSLADSIIGSFKEEEKE